MIVNALMFVVGAWAVQQMAYLPSATWLAAIFLSAISLTVINGSLHLRFKLQLPKPLTKTLNNTILNRAIFSLAVLLFGIVWASGFALWRMSDELPHRWEQKTIAIIGVVASVPEVGERGVRFRFDVEETLTDSAVVPSHISLNYYVFSKNHDDSSIAVPDKPVNHFHAGERWQLTVRLKRPHGTANPHGFDFESWALGENIRATGSIKSNAVNIKLQDFVATPAYILEHLREKIKLRIEKVLPGKPYSGIIQALVIGDDNQISADDWQVFLRTGTSHLMSISGLHITIMLYTVIYIICFLSEIFCSNQIFII